jgi:hypothetical protein
MADFDSIKISARQHIEEIPEHVQYPSLRMNFDTLEKGDTIAMTLKIIALDGKVKLDEGHKIILKEYPDNMKVVGRGVLNLIEVEKPQVDLAMQDIKSE